MGIENPKTIFLKKLKEIEDTRVIKKDPIYENVRKFDHVYEKKLIEVEQSFLNEDFILPVVEIVKEAVRVIEIKEGFDRQNELLKQYPKDGARELKFKKSEKFDVEFLGYHGDKCYPSQKNQSTFVQAVEGGKPISELIKGFGLKYTCSNLVMGVKIMKDVECGNLTMSWEMGETSGALKVENFDLLPFIELLANGIVDRKYADNRSSCIPGMEGWTPN